MSEQLISNNSINHPIVGFAAGTKLMTASGLVPIEQLQAGDTIEVAPRVPIEGLSERLPTTIEVFERRAEIVDIELPLEREEDGPECDFPWWERN